MFECYETNTEVFEYYETNTEVLVFQNVVLEENTTGRDGQEYVLHCSVESPALQRLGGPALTYDIPFLFYNGQSCIPFSLSLCYPTTMNILFHLQC